MNASGKRVVLLDSDDEPGEWVMEFRLTYEGPLYATQRDPVPGQMPKHTQNRHDIRIAFHKQLRELWGRPPLTNEIQRPKVLMTRSAGDAPRPATSIDSLAKKHALYGFNFVPLVTFEHDLVCSLEILLLRPDRPGGVIWGGDIDNRIKTLFDALRIPEAGERYVDRQPSMDESPMFCLLEDDKLITKASIETDRLLEPIGETIQASDARLVMTVRLRPYDVSISNLHFS